MEKGYAVSVDRTRDLQIFSLTLSQLSYPRLASGWKRLLIVSIRYNLDDLKFQLFWV